MDETSGEPIAFTPHCKKCGSNELTIPDDATDESPVTCSSCGAVCGAWGDLRAAAVEAAGQHATESFVDAIGRDFDGSEGVTFKKIE